MTNTTDKIIDILNSSIFPIVGLETKIQKVGPTNPVLTIPADQQNLESSTISGDNTEDATSAEIARQELIKARRARLAGE